MGGTFSAIVKPFTTIADAFASIINAIEDIGEGFINEIALLVKILMKLVTIFAKLAELTANLLLKGMPLIELSIFIAPTIAIIFSSLISLNQFQSIDLGEYEKLKPKINQLMLALAVVVELFIYLPSGLGWIDTLPKSISTDIISFDTAITRDTGIAIKGTTANIDLEQVKITQDRTSAGSFVPGEGLTSINGLYQFVLQSDGNMVVKLVSSQRVLWSPHTEDKLLETLYFQEDGNLVGYNGKADSVWSSNTAGYDDAVLIMQNDGNLVIMSSSGKAIWSTQTPMVSVKAVAADTRVHQTTVETPLAVDTDTLYQGTYARGKIHLTSANQRYTLRFQSSDGNLVIYDKTVAIWSSHSTGGTYLDFQKSDGNIIISNDIGNLIWSIHKWTPRQPCKLVMQNDANLVVYDKNNAVLWAAF